MRMTEKKKNDYLDKKLEQNQKDKHKMCNDKIKRKDINGETLYDP